MARLDLSLLGNFRAQLDGQALAWFKSDKTRALLAYLAVEAGQPHRRGSVVALLWPEQPESLARANLSQALYNLRSTLGDRKSGGQDHPRTPFFLVDTTTIRFSPTGDHCVDVTRFASLLGACTEHSHDLGQECDLCMQRLGEAVALYRGSFLQDLSIPDSVPFEEWCSIRREQLHRQALEALQRLAAAHERRGEYERGLPYAWRHVELEPWREEGQRQLIRLLAAAGQRSAALAQYEACRRALAKELNAEPAIETTALYESIRQGATDGPDDGRRARLPVIDGYRANSRTTHNAAPDVHASARLPIAAASNPAFVAREREMGRLEAWLEEALAGQGRVGFVVGEPGSGKTMLLREFARRAMEARPELVVAGSSCNAYAGLGDAYYPFVEILRLLTGDIEARRAAGSLSPEHARRLRETMPLVLEGILREGPALIDTLIARAPLLERARALPEGANWEARVQDVVSRRPAVASPVLLHDQVSQVLHTVAASRPLLLVLDDLQWADGPSISLLFHLARQLAGQRLLILSAYRPEEVAAGRPAASLGGTASGNPHPLASVLRELQVQWEDLTADLAQADGRAMVEALVDRDPNRLEAAFRDALHRRTGGHALFTVELLRGLQQRGGLVRHSDGSWVEGPTLNWDLLPRRVEAVIAAHVARLPAEEQELLSAASIEGEEFHAEVVARVLGRGEREVVAALSGPLSQEHNLVRAQSVRRLGEQRFSRYRFRHYLFQHYLYQRLDPVRRAHLHGEVASALEALGAAPVVRHDRDIQWVMDDDRSDVVGGPEWVVSEAAMAGHYEEAGLAEKAALYHVHAGRRACYLSLRYDEVRSHLLRALELLATLPETPWRMRWEQTCYHVVAWTWAMSKSWLADEVGQAWRSSVERAERIGDPLLVADALTFLCMHYRSRGELELAQSLGERAVVLAQGGLSGWVRWVEGCLATTLLCRGDLARASRLLAPLFESLLRAGAVPPPPLNVENVALAPLVLWCLGYPDQAARVGRAALDMVEKEENHAQVGIDCMVTFNAICLPSQLRGEIQGVEWALSRIEPLVEARQCPPFWFPVIKLCEGWVRATRGFLEEGLAGMRQGLVESRRNSIPWAPLYQGWIAEALARAGRVDEGLSLLDEALGQVERTNERWSEAELRRLKGELLLQRGSDAEDVENCFRRAITVAQKQEARSWELRATTSLARLLRAQGRAVEAREALAAIYGWFTEGFDTPDLMEAGDLLEGLS